MIGVYSPKISEDLIPLIYKIGKNENKPMTKVVDVFLRESIERYVSNLETGNFVKDSSVRGDYVSEILEYKSIFNNETRQVE